MEKLAHSEVVILLIQVAIMLLFARIFGELARKVKQPIIIGEIIAGIILGPTILGVFMPDLFTFVFTQNTHTSFALDGLVSMSVILLLFIAGLEVEMHIVLEQGKKAIGISLLGMIIPFASGFLLPYFFPDIFNLKNQHSKLLFSLFLGTAMSITALPVLAKILLDLNLFKSKLGIPIIVSAMINDLLGWLVFSVVLSMMTAKSSSFNVFYTIFLTLGFTLFMFTVGKKMLDKLLPWINKNFSWPGGFLSITIVICFLCAAFTEYIGIHAVFGAFIVGVAMSDTSHLTVRAKEIIHQFVNNIFAPLFLVSIGLKVNFIANFDLTLVIIVIILATAGKVIGCGLGAYFSGFTKNESLAVGFGMNTRGAMEIILGTLALEYGLIDEKIFIALVVMALVTSISSGPLMKYFLKN